MAWRGGILLGVAVAAVATSTPVLTEEQGSLLQFGGPASTAILTGSGFEPGAVAQWDGQDLSTTFVSSTELFAVIPASDLTAIGPATLTVANSDGGTSNDIPLFVEPALNSMTPNSAVAGSGEFTLTLTGAGFPAGWVVDWNGSLLATTYVSSTELTAMVPAGLVSTAGQDWVWVARPDQEEYSRSLSFTLTSAPPAAPPPVVTSLSPPSAALGGPGFTLTVNGSGFIAASTVEWNKQGLATTFVSATQLTAQVPASDILNSGSASVTVVNPGVAPSAALTFTVAQPAPVLNSFSPSSAVAGTPAFTLTVNGSGLVLGSLVQWNGAMLNMAFLSSAQVTATVDAFRIATPGTATVSVWNPSGALSGNLTFVIAAPSGPTLSSLSPATVVAGASGFALVVNGTGFASGAAVQWNGAVLSTTFVSSTQLTTQVPASDAATAGSVSVTAVNPGGALSNALTFTITAALPVVSSISPATATAGGATFTLAVNGSGFVSGSVVEWSGAVLNTTFVSSTRLTATVPAADIAAAAAISVIVVNPPGAVSGGVTFTVTGTQPGPPAALTSLYPSAATAGGSGVVLTASGGEFISGSAIRRADVYDHPQRRALHQRGFRWSFPGSVSPAALR